MPRTNWIIIKQWKIKLTSLQPRFASSTSILHQRQQLHCDLQKRPDPSASVVATHLEFKYNCPPRQLPAGLSDWTWHLPMLSWLAHDIHPLLKSSPSRRVSSAVESSSRTPSPCRSGFGFTATSRTKSEYCSWKFSSAFLARLGSSRVNRSVP